MENFKQYLPWIIAAAIGLYVLSRLRSQSTRLMPQTQITETPQVDPFAEPRAGAFAGLLQLAGLQIGADTERAAIAGETERARLAGALSARGQDLQLALGGRSFDVELARIDAASRAAIQSANLGFLQREQDRQIQQSAIDRYYSSRTTSDIIGSVGQALGMIFGGRGSSGGGIFGTPPINPGGFGGGFGGFF